MARAKAKKQTDSPSIRHDFGVEPDWTPTIRFDNKDGLVKVPFNGDLKIISNARLDFEWDPDCLEVLKGYFGEKGFVNCGPFTGNADLEADEKPIVKGVFYSETVANETGQPLGLREFISASLAFRMSMSELEEAAFTVKRPPDSVVAFTHDGFEQVSFGKGRAMKVKWTFTEWRPRRSEFIDYAVKNSIGATTPKANVDPNDSLPELGGDRIEV